MMKMFQVPRHMCKAYFLLTFVQTILFLLTLTMDESFWIEVTRQFLVEWIKDEKERDPFLHQTNLTKSAKKIQSGFDNIIKHLAQNYTRDNMRSLYHIHCRPRKNDKSMDFYSEEEEDDYFEFVYDIPDFWTFLPDVSFTEQRKYEDDEPELSRKYTWIVLQRAFNL